MKITYIIFLLSIVRTTCATVDFGPLLSGRAYITSDTATVTNNINLRVDINLIGSRELIEPDWRRCYPRGIGDRERQPYSRPSDDRRC